MYLLPGLGSIQSDISAAAARYHVPPSLALAVAQRESGFNQAAVGTSGELGVFQLMPGTAAQLGVNPSDLAQNIDGGVRYLSQMYAQFGDWRTALEAYNGGPGNVSRGTVSSAAQGYADAVLAASGVDSSTDYGSLSPSLPSPAVDNPVWASPFDFSGGGDGTGAGLSSGAMVALGLAAFGLLWAALD